jgi:hypothetical protein
MAKRNRRTFLRSVAAVPLVFTAAETGQAQEPPAPFSNQVEELAKLVELRYGKYLADGDMGEIKRGIERMVRNAERISRVKITNADEPDFLFHPGGSL